MLTAVFSDAHGNREALEAVIAFCRHRGVDRFCFAGDAVGYGADPDACIRLLEDVGAESVLGNHDAAALGKVDTMFFNRAAQEAIVWSASHLSREGRRFLEGLPLARTGAFMVVHGSPAHPEQFDYLLSPYDAVKAFFAFRDRLCFVGHVHCPGVLVEEETAIRFDASATFELAAGRRYIVNVGSVGQPRDGDPRACVCLYDDGRAALTLHRVAYDVARAAQKIRTAGLPSALADRLFEGR